MPGYSWTVIYGPLNYDGAIKKAARTDVGVSGFLAVYVIAATHCPACAILWVPKPDHLAHINLVLLCIDKYCITNPLVPNDSCIKGQSKGA